MSGFFEVLPLLSNSFLSPVFFSDRESQPSSLSVLWTKVSKIFDCFFYFNAIVF